jgi:hypothetical protein
MWHWPDKQTTAAGVYLVARYRLHRKIKWPSECKTAAGIGYVFLLPIAKRVHVRTATMPRKVTSDWRRSATQLLGVATHAWGLVDLTHAEAYSYNELNFTSADDETVHGNFVHWRFTMPKLP